MTASVVTVMHPALLVPIAAKFYDFDPIEPGEFTVMQNGMDLQALPYSYPGKCDYCGSASKTDRCSSCGAPFVHKPQPL